MTVEFFDAEGKYDKPCMACARVGMARKHVVQGNQQRVYCPYCGCGTPWGLILNLKQNNRTARKEYPFGEDLESVWERFQNRCVVCSRTKEELTALGVQRDRQHVAEHAKEGHRGPLVPICARCHMIATALQRDAEVTRAFIRYSRTHAEPISTGRSDLPGNGLSPDPVRPAGEAPIGAVEGLSDDDADR